jgi:hypothetical protein
MSTEVAALRYKLVPSRRPSLYLVGTREQADEAAQEIAIEDDAGVAVCESPLDDPRGFRNLGIVGPPRERKVRRR